MAIQSATLHVITNKQSEYPNSGHPEFVFLGRSNVGKSSLINALTNQKKLAYTSGTPGKTQALHFYLINDHCFFVDVPGYGYATVSKTRREAFGEMIETYLTSREQLQLAFVLIDGRHTPSVDDDLMVEYLQYHDIPFRLLITKMDKIGSTLRHRHLKTIATHFQVDLDQLIATSAEVPFGLDEIRVLLGDCVSR